MTNSEWELKLVTNSYRLTAAEKTLFTSLNSLFLNAKAQVYDLDKKIAALKAEKHRAESEIETRQKQFDGALAMLVENTGLSGAVLSNDFTTLIKQ